MSTKKRLHLKAYNKNMSKNRILLVCLLIFFLSIFFIVSFNKKSSGSLITYAENVFITESNYLINRVVKETMNKNNYSYEDLSEVLYNSNNEIVSVDFNSMLVNNLLNDVTESLNKQIKEFDYYNKQGNIYYIPFGVVTNMNTFRWLGIKVPIKVFTSTSFETEIISNVKSYGINNSLYEVNLKVKLLNVILLSNKSKDVVVEVEAPIVKKVIQGKIPEIYGGFYSKSSSLHAQELEE